MGKAYLCLIRMARCMEGNRLCKEKRTSEDET